jgi:hypothetical protein
LEERIFRRDPHLSVVDMDVMESFWKNLFIWITIPIFLHIPVPTSTCSSGVLENNMDAIYEVMNYKLLRSLVIWNIVITLCVTFLCLFIIKMTNAMQKVMLALLKTFLMWIFFMAWPDEGHEDFNVIKMIGMLLLAAGTVWYITLDIKDLELEAK